MEIYKLLTNTSMWKLGLRPAISFLGIFVSNFRYFQYRRAKNPPVESSVNSIMQRLESFVNTAFMNSLSGSMPGFVERAQGVPAR